MRRQASWISRLRRDQAAEADAAGAVALGEAVDDDGEVLASRRA